MNCSGNCLCKYASNDSLYVQPVWLLTKSKWNVYAVSKIPKQCQRVTLPYKCHRHLHHLTDGFTSLCNLRNNKKLRYKRINLYIEVSNQMHTMIYLPVFCNSIWIPSDSPFCVIAGICLISVAFHAYFQKSNIAVQTHTRLCNRSYQVKLQNFLT